MAVRGAMHRAGAQLVGHLLSLESAHPQWVPCPCGAEAHFHSRRSRRLLTALGLVEFERAYYTCPRCHQGQSPRDRELDVEGTECSPGVCRMMSLVGSESSFQQSREQLELLAGLEVTAKAVVKSNSVACLRGLPPARRAGPCAEEGGHRRRRRLDLESG